MDATAEHADLRREVQRLQAENARLSRLLELRGQDTAPSPEQLSAPVAAPGMVTMASPVADKLALFADRFRARTDVYAVCWKTLVRVHPGGHQPSPTAGARGWIGAAPLIFLARRKSWRLISSATFSWASTRCYVHHVAGGMDIDLHDPVPPSRWSRRPSSTSRRAEAELVAEPTHQPAAPEPPGRFPA